MAAAKTFTCDLDPTRTGLALTFIVPGGCNLRCPFCFIGHRGEAEGPEVLEPDDYASFVRDIAGNLRVRVVGLQGYEPLRPEAWPYTVAILQEARDCGIATSLVTNGTHLEGRIGELDKLGLRDLTVSLDSPDAEQHDRLRGVPGAFANALRGIRKTLKDSPLAERLVVASVLLPNRLHLLTGMPSFLASLGVRYFGVTPLIRVGSPSFGAIPRESKQVIGDLDLLQSLSVSEGIRFVVDDEFNQFRNLDNGMNRFVVHRLERADRLIRLSPSGACSIGAEILQKVGEDTPVWNPRHETPTDFVMRLGVYQSPLMNRLEPSIASVRI